MLMEPFYVIVGFKKTKTKTDSSSAFSVENNLDDQCLIIYLCIYFFWCNVLYVSLECSRIYGIENDLEGFTYCKREKNTTL